MKKVVTAFSLFLITLCLGDVGFFSQVLTPPSRGDAAAQSRVGSGGTVRGGIPGGAIVAPAALPNSVRQIQDGQYAITDTRPLEIVAQLLSRKLGVPIAYEEPAWMAGGDVMRAADNPRGQGVTSRNNSRGPLIPRGGSVDVFIPTSPSVDKFQNVSNIIQAALNSHRSHKNPGDFKLVTFGEGEFSIVAERAGNEAGLLVNQLSPLDARISFPEAERTLRETIDIIYESIRKTGHVALTDLGPHMQDFDTLRLKLGANGDVARDVLEKALRGPGRSKLSWTLRYDPENRIYLIMLIGVQAEVPIQGGGVGLRSLSWPK